MTRVVFRKWKNGDIIALFPDKWWCKYDYTTTSYMHTGQHGAADYTGVIATTQPAREHEYRELLAELEFIGYKDLHIIQKARPKFN